MEEKLANATVTLNIGGASMDIKMELPMNPVRLRRMLPVFQSVSDTLISAGVEGLESQGQAISCRAGCGACCRQIVPIAEVEAHHLREVVEKMAEPRRSEIRSKFETGAKHFRDLGWFERAGKALANSMEEYVETVDDYFRVGIACPFLENESCSIHPYRPLACREYMVTSPAENCSNPDGEGVNTVEHLLLSSNSVIKLNGSRSEHGLPYVPLIQALEFAEKYPESESEMTGDKWAGLFFQGLTED